MHVLVTQVWRYVNLFRLNSWPLFRRSEDNSMRELIDAGNTFFPLKLDRSRLRIDLEKYRSWNDWQFLAFFAQITGECTRNDSILDLIITNCPGFIQNSGVDDPINDLDHCPIYGSMNFKYPKKSCYYRTISQYNETNLNALNENLSLVPWHALLSANEV